jgi:hypothetical protein
MYIRNRKGPNTDPWGTPASIPSHPDENPSKTTFSQNWAIKFNPNKTESILLTRRNINNPPVYFWDMDNRVTDVNTHCHLGLDLQSNCKWGDYVSKIYKKACEEFDITIKIINNIVYVYKEQERAQH